MQQGDLLSPVLLNLIIDGLLSCLHRQIGVKVEDAFANVTAFADDISDNYIRFGAFACAYFLVKDLYINLQIVETGSLDYTSEM